VRAAGTLAYKLAPSGKRILLLERGGFVPREKDNWESRAVNVEGKYNTGEVWYDKDGETLHPHTNYFVGGNTKFYGAALFVSERRTSVRFATTTAFLPRGRFPTKILSRTTHKPRIYIMCTGIVAKTQRRPGPAVRFRMLQ
jgi:choline dehydrogenase-like flavoprotein